MYNANTQKKVWVAILILDKVDLLAKETSSNREYHTILKGLINQKEITILNTCVPNYRVSKYMK